PGHGHVRCATSAPRSTPTARVIQSSAKWSCRRMRCAVSTQELLVGGSGGDLNRLPPRQARTPRVKLAPAIPAQLSVMARISEFLAIPQQPRDFGGFAPKILKRRPGSGPPARI